VTRRDPLRPGDVLYSMRRAAMVGLLIGILGATVACGAYRFPGPGSETGNVHGQVFANSCGGPVQQSDQPCPATSSSCPPQPVAQGCGVWPVPGLELVFTNGSNRLVTKTDTAGSFSIDLPVGTWSVSTASFARIVSGPQTVVVNAGTSITADYVVDTGMRAAA